MGVLVSSSEIVESVEEEVEEQARDRSATRAGKRHSIEDDINRLFQAIEARSLAKYWLRRSAMKRPMRSGGGATSSGIGVAEPASLKQALRGLCISQASEMAAAKRMTMMSKPPGSSSEARHIKRLYRAVVVEADVSGLPMSRGEKGSFVEVSLVPEDAHIVEVASNLTERCQKGEMCLSGKTSKSFMFRSKSRVEKTAVDTDSSHEHATSATSSSEGSSSVSVTSRSGGKRPHMSRDSRWEAIRRIRGQHGGLGLSHFKLLRRLGCGDIGTVYLAELAGTSSLFALKVMDNEFLASRKKMLRAQTERDILQMLDHPFLPTLFAHFVSEKLSCLVMEYCPSGDLHVLRQKQPTRSFSEQAARFYVAEVLVALEYLHMLGVVYRDLKPENILVREDGHIMLSDFDLSLRGAAVNPTVEKLSGPPAKKERDPSCIDPFCQVSCFAPTRRSSSPPAHAGPLPQLVVEPTGARSNSFVGTHEYLAPEIVKGEGHGSCVDWWTLGIFLFELLYGTTPFKGPTGNEETLANVTSKSLKFPSSPTMVSFHARDLIRGLLVKDPEGRLGSVKGAAEIKRHPFFDGLNWALIRCTVPPKLSDSAGSAPPLQKQERSEQTEFEMF